MSRVRRLFDYVRDMPDGQRETALREAGVDAETHAAVMALLDAAAQTGTFLADPVPNRPARKPTSELAAAAIVGAWRLLREIGHGGMGAVFLAERADGHFSQQAAIKLIRGFADAETAAYFERERQLLADLQHPQIARLLDGGATPNGLPYLVMEYVDGMPIDAWCAQQQPDLPTRLALFASVCGAVHYAHQRRVVHCDIKPSNVLVRADGVPVLLDFGIAHAVDPHPSGTPLAPQQELSPVAMANHESHAVHSSRSTPTSRLTPRYASPEQLRGETLTITTDIYSLGLMLYTLVSGQPPQRGSDNIAPLPSTANGKMAWRIPVDADLDAIVARACAPDPGERYASAQALAEDVQRIARHEPVQARKPSWNYLFGRLMRRRWPAFVVAALAVVVAAAFAWRLVLAEQAALREAAAAQQATDFIVSVFSASDAGLSDGALHELTARNVLDNGAKRVNQELVDQPHIRARLLEALGHAYRHMNLGHVAVPLLREAADLNLSAEVANPLAGARCLEALTNAMANGEFPSVDVEKVAYESLALNRRLSAADSQEMANALMVFSLALYGNGKYEKALEAAYASLAINQRKLPRNRLAAAYGNLTLIHSSHGDYEQAARFNAEALAMSKPDSVGYGMRLAAKARLQIRRGDSAAAIEDMREAINLVASKLGDSESFATYFRVSLANMLTLTGEYAEADALLSRTLHDQAAISGKDSGEYLLSQVAMATLRHAQGRLDVALAMRRDNHQRRLAQYGAEDPLTLSSAIQLADTLIQSQHADHEARELLDHALAYWASNEEVHAPPALLALQVLARWHLARNDPTSALSVLAQIDRDRPRMPLHERLEQGALHTKVAQLQGDRALALQLSQQSFTEHQTALGSAHPRTAMRALTWADALRDAGQVAHASDIQNQWQPQLAAVLPMDSSHLR